MWITSYTQMASKLSEIQLAVCYSQLASLERGKAFLESMHEDGILIPTSP